jgi:hypothetical protein
MSDDEMFTALTEVLALLEKVARWLPQVAARTDELKSGRARGESLASLLTGATEPLVVDVLSDLLQGVFAVGSRLRRAEARALYAEGLSMEDVGLLLGVSRQRISAIINSPFGPGDQTLIHPDWPGSP